MVGAHHVILDEAQDGESIEGKEGNLAEVRHDLALLVLEVE